LTYLFTLTIVSLYNPNASAIITVNELTVIKSCLSFNQTNIAIDNLCKLDLEKEQDNYSLQYIDSYLNNNNSITLRDLITDNKYFINQNMLLNYLLENVKKSKRLFYVHSLIYREQLKHRGLADMDLCSYVQKDASSSGLQMLSILFRDLKLAEIANLKDNNYYDIYTKASDNCLKEYNRILKFYNNNLEWSGFDNLENSVYCFDQLMRPTRGMTSHDLESRIKPNSQSLEDLFIVLWDIDFKRSTITTDFLLILINALISYKSKDNKSLDFK